MAPRQSRTRYHRRLREPVDPQGPNAVANDLWIEQDFEDGWVAFLRIVDQGGAPVVAEVRVVPRTSKGPHGRRAKPGEWSETPSDVPRGGLTQRGQLRRVRLEEAMQHAADDYLRRTASGGGFSVSGFGGHEGWAFRTRPGGGRRLTDADLAALVADYLGLVAQRVQNPVEAVAGELGLKPAGVRERLRKAAARGLFTPLKRGVAGGELTDKGRASLEEEDR
ncbi:MAG: hypothetical protein AB7O78_09840 [Thermoleophilia bacterium]